MWQKIKKEIDFTIFVPTILIIVILTALIVSNPERATGLVNGLMSAITGNFSWLILGVNFATLAFLLWLAFGKYKNVKLGDTKPEFSTFSWIAMLFCGGIGVSIMYWGAIEWAFYVQTPPFGVEPFSAEAFEWASAYGMFHWGPGAWAFYCLCGIPIAYVCYVRRKPVIRLSAACEGILGKHTEGFWGKAIDVFSLVGLLGGIATALGLGTPLVTAGLADIFGVPDSFATQMIVIMVWVVAFGMSTYMGINKGIKNISNINVWATFAVLAFILFAGPTRFILDNTMQGVGIMGQNFLRMSFYTDPIRQTGFAQDWTVFYYFWWLASGPFMGLWVARISKGRTFREMVLAQLLWGTLGCVVVFGVLGNFAMDLQLTGALDVTGIMAESGGFVAVVEVIKMLPLGKIMLPIFILVAALFCVTTMDSAAFTLAMVSSRAKDENHDPARWFRMIWVVALAAFPVCLLLMGGLEPVQTAVIVLGFPLLFIFILLMISFKRMLNKDDGVLINLKGYQQEKIS